MKFIEKGGGKYAKCKRCETVRNIHDATYCVICKDMNDEEVKIYKKEKNEERRKWERQNEM
jgi:ribosomal protein L44E